MKPGASEYAQYVLHNTDNYNSLIQNTSQEILTKFTEVIIDYMRLIAEKINIKNKHYYVFIFERGIETIVHIFSMIFYYTKNLDLTFYHSQKAYYFYIEFIEQISDDNITFLQLSSRDALLFVYKKTIYELNNEYKKTIPPLTSDETNILSCVDAYIVIYKKIVNFIINHKKFIYENKIEYIHTCCNRIQKNSIILNKNKIKIKKNGVDCICLLINLLSNSNIKDNINIDVFFDSLEEVIKYLQIKKKVLDDKTIQCIKDKIYECDINNYIDVNGIETLVEYIFTSI
jgi:hypothetical protein